MNRMTRSICPEKWEFKPGIFGGYCELKNAFPSIECKGDKCTASDGRPLKTVVDPEIHYYTAPDGTTYTHQMATTSFEIDMW